LAQEYASVVYVDIVQEKHLRVLNQVANDLSKEQKIINLRATTRSINALGIQYLRSRGISCELPDSIRMKDDMWHSEAKQKLPVLVSFAKNQKGEITAAQSIYLDKSSGAKAKVMPAKRTLGALKGSFVEIQKNHIDQGKTNITILAEGIETALSIKEARIPGRILCSLGIQNLRHYKPTKDEIVIIAADNDGGNLSTKKALDIAITNLSQQGAKVEIIFPKELGDFNDVLINKGFKEVQSSLMTTIEKYLTPEQKNSYRVEHSVMTQSGRTKNEVMLEIEKNRNIISKAWAGGNLPTSDKNFGIIDFEGQKHTTEYTYFLALATDPKIKDLIDYDSKLGKEIQQTLNSELSKNRGLNL
jgi:hypothetical protein